MFGLKIYWILNRKKILYNLKTFLDFREPFKVFNQNIVNLDRENISYKIDTIRII